MHESIPIWRSAWKCWENPKIHRLINFHCHLGSIPPFWSTHTLLKDMILQCKSNCPWSNPWKIGKSWAYKSLWIDDCWWTAIYPNFDLGNLAQKNPKGLHRRGKAMVFIREIVFKWWVFSTSNWVIHAMIRWQTSASGFASKGFTPHARLESASGCRCGLDDTWECHVSHWHLTHWHDIIYIYICIYYIIWFKNIVSIYVCMYVWMDGWMHVWMYLWMYLWMYV